MQNKNLSLSQAISNNPILLIEQGHIKINFFKKLLGSWKIQHLKISDLELSASPLFSPTGIASVWLKKTSILYYFENSEQHCPSIFGEYMGLPFSLNGKIHHKHFSTGNRKHPFSISNLLKEYHEFVRKSLKFKPQLDKITFETPFLDFWIEGVSQDKPITVNGSAFCRKLFINPFLLKAEKVSLTWKADYLGSRFGESSFAHLKAKGLVHKNYSCENFDARFKINSFGVNSWIESENWVQGFQEKDYVWNPLSFSLIYKNSRNLSILAQTFLNDQFLQIKTNTVDDFSGKFYAQTTADPKTILANLPRFLQNTNLVGVLSLVAYQEGNGLILKGNLKAGAKLVELNFEIDAKKISFREWSLDHAKASGYWDGKSLIFHNILLDNKGSKVSGDLAWDKATQTVELALSGDFTENIVPPVMPTWWAGIFRNFMDGQIISGDIKVRFPSEFRNDWFFFGHAQAKDFLCRNLKFNQGSLKFWGLPQFTSLFDWKMEKLNGAINGELYMVYKRGDASPQLTGFFIESSTELPTLARSIHKEVVKVVEKFDFSQNPELLVYGTIPSKNTDFSEQSWLKITADSKGFVQFEEYPFDDLKFSALYHNKILNLSKIESIFCKGILRGNANLDFSDSDKKIITNFNLSNASEMALRSLFQSSKRLKKQLTDGTISILGNLKGNYGDISSFQSSGTASFNKENLGKFPLLGIISEISSIGELKLDQAQSDFSLRGNEIDFKNLEITGPITAISGSGTYQLTNQSLDFSLEILPFRQIPLLSPISKILEVSLKGTLENPRPSLKNSPINIF